MNDESVRRATGHALGHWFDVIAAERLAEADHKTIADFLHDNEGVSYWWAQTITVEYEQHIGRRIPGQTQDGFFQLGVSKTLYEPAATVWGFFNSPEGMSLVLAEPGTGSEAGRDASHGDVLGLAGLALTTGDGLSVVTTTCVPGSHARLRWKEEGWETHSILQIRVTARDDKKATVTFHQEKLPGPVEREIYLERWSALLARAEAVFAENRASG